MTRYWRVYFWTALVLVVANCWGLLMPLGVEGHPVQMVGFPRAFWQQWGTEIYFRWWRLGFDLFFALIVCHRIAKWAERREGW